MHIFYDDEVPENIIKTPEDELARLALIEQFPDPGYELDQVHPDDLDVLNRIREYFGDRGHYPVTFKELRNAMYHKCKEKFGKSLSQVDFTIMMRGWWRAGHTRRFVRGRSGKMYPPGRGGWFGVHYILYPNKEFNARPD